MPSPRNTLSATETNFGSGGSAMGGGKRTCLHPQRLAYALTAFGNRFLATLFFSAIGYICPSKGLSHLKKCGIRLLSDIRNTGECNYCDAGSQNDVLHHRRTQLTRSQESDDCSRLVILSFSFHKNHLDSVRFCHSPGYLSSARPPLAACLAGNYNSSGLAATRTPLGGGAVSPSVPPFAVGSAWAGVAAAKNAMQVDDGRPNKSVPSPQRRRRAFLQPSMPRTPGRTPFQIQREDTMYKRTSDVPTRAGNRRTRADFRRGPRLSPKAPVI